MYICSQHAVAAILFACVMLRSYNEVLNNKAVKTDVIRAISLFVKIILYSHF